MAEASCTHQDQIKSVTPQSASCAECLKTGGKPVANRLCLTCGHVGCCDSSIGRHARAHFTETGHAIMEPLDVPAGQTKWQWCYIDDAYVL